MPGDDVTIEVNGRDADRAAVSLLEHEGWGHFTAMQVRGGRTRGLGLHLSRLEAAHQELYGRVLGGPEVRARIRHALGGRLRRQLSAAGAGQAEEPVFVPDLAGYDGMILCNSRGWAPVGRVDELRIPEAEAFTGVIAAAFDGCPWDEI